MPIRNTATIFEKLTKMGDVTLFEPAGDAPFQEVQHSDLKQKRTAFDFADCISHVQTPRGSKPVLKTMITSAC
ncbi:MAG: hypothetical protein KC546_07025, partial [Anaerolineae bacterium]|nr:hypothetical protein [Anaerolineae bacterium]